MKNAITIVLIMLVPVMVLAQLSQDDSLAYEKLRGFPEFEEHLETSQGGSKVALTICGNSLWMIPTGGFYMYDFYTYLGVGFSGLGYSVSVFPTLTLMEARKILISCGFDRIPGNALYKAVTRAQAVSTAITLTGLASTGLAVCGMIFHDDLVFGIAIGVAMTSTIMSVFVPILTNKVVEIYKKDAASLKVGAVNNGIGMVYQFR